MKTYSQDETLLDDLNDEQLDAMIRLIKAGKLDFEVHSTNPGHWSHDIGIIVDHEELMAAMAEEKSHTKRRKP